MLIGYFTDRSEHFWLSGIFTSILQNYFTDVLETEPDISDNFTAVLDHSDRSSKPDRRSAY